jgi:purine-binding chemotaxis protein CheW
MELQLVIFKLGNESFGVEIATVESIIKMQTITRLPQAPSFVEGIINLRGKILPVVDLRKRLNIDLTEITKDSRMVVVALAGSTVAMVVDQVNEVLRINDDIVEAPPAISQSVDSRFIEGIAKINEDLVILLNLSKVLDTSETSILASFASVPA